MHDLLPEATQSTTVNHRRHICTACERPTVVGRSTNQSHACLNLSCLYSGFLTLHSNHNIDLCEIFECAHVKFTVSGRSIAVLPTRVHNAVMLLWGSLRLAPTKQCMVKVW